jgi:hypothetical protein
MTQNMTKRGAAALAVACLATVLLATAALAATSGRVYRSSPDSVYSACSRADIVATADNKAYTSSFTTLGACAGTYSAAAGWLGARAFGFRDGNYCGSTSWHYNSGSTWEFGVGAKLCSNPAGSQSFHTTADSRAWKPYSLSYADHAWVTSPSQNY